MDTTIAILSLLLNGVILFILFTRLQTSQEYDISRHLQIIYASLEKLEKSLREEMSQNRQEWNLSALENRKELQQSFTTLTKTTLSTLRDTSAQQKYLLDSFAKQLNDLTQMNEKKFDSLRAIVEEKLTVIQADNEKKLEEMRQTVDEKLHDTLEKRLGESFQLVSKRLEQVHKSLGKMQILASGVDHLRKVLSNVKNRGVLGEIQLENILEQMMSIEQYEKNVHIRKNSKENVEFAIKLPSKQENGDDVLLPIDSKFPLDDYQRLLEAQDSGDLNKMNEAGRNLENRIKQEAKKICEKYILPPVTTDFAILFLPLEGLYAEVLRRPGLWEFVQRKYRVAIVGPTTLSAFLNSLQMGFRTLAIEKHTHEAWQWLSIVKNDLYKFGEYLAKAQKKIEEAGKTIGQASRQTETMKKKLHKVEKLPQIENPALPVQEDLASGE
ncbi:DNA recombination protein RmuC [Thermoactinomyces mirandus]|uniref:DNA recombination protein RmuC n=1 Tax=Thermoactinomyces mirandus TaxID=2756294 RepID=A0A7W1XQI8_9BACL|nr:DNA recombination protein RmuC [Thermoactinomyces mirandus]MBA4601210.1 DNA recombination protein RmuC [Thermoactinomyces mirandus]